MVLSRQRIVLLSLITCFIISSEVFSASNYRRTFTVMTYNVENLFDSLHDEGKEDYTFLPLSRKETDPEIRSYCAGIRNPYYRKQCFELDWNENVVVNKVQNVARVIKEAGSPEIIVFQEVENINALRKLKNVGLSSEGYRELVLVEGPDKRGIDVAIMSKLPLVGDVKYHQIDLSPAYEDGEKVKLTRGILEATFNFKGNRFSVFANHWPSQRNINETRMISARTLIKAVKNSKYPAIVAGDFNIHENDRPNAINELMINNSLDFSFFDFEKMYFGDHPASGFIGEHRGTHFYRNKWSSLDRIFVPKTHTKIDCKLSDKNRCIFPVWASYKVIKLSFMLEDRNYTDVGAGSDVTVKDVPKRFDPLTGLGVSDHLPAIAKFSF